MFVLSLRQWTQWHTVIIYRPLFTEVRQQAGRRFQVSTIFFTSSCAKFHVQTSGWTECFKQVHRHYLILDSNQIPLKFPSLFFLSYPKIRTYIFLRSGKEIMQTARRRIFRILEEIPLCQPIERVYVCFEMTDIKVISDPLSLRKFDSSQDFCRIGFVSKCRPSLCMSSRTENLSRGFVHVKLYIRLISASNDTCCRQTFWENQNIFCINKFFPGIFRFYDNTNIYCEDGQDTNKI